MLVDSHCHLHDREFFTAEQAERMLGRARKAGVEKIICIGTSHEDSLMARDFANSHKNVYWTYGIHPENAGVISELRNTHLGHAQGRSAKPTVLDEYSLNSDEIKTERPRPVSEGSGERPEKEFSSRPVAIGEVGLDYHYEGYDREVQIKLFEEMLQLATDNDLPVSFHVREAFEDFFPVVANFPRVRGVVHSFTDSKKTLRRILNETEFYVGVNGLATYSTLPTPPLERILLETDAPFLAPVPHRGETNEPTYVADVAKWLAEKLTITVEEAANVTTGNAVKFFRLDV